MKHAIFTVFAPVCAIAMFVSACTPDGNDPPLSRADTTTAPQPESTRPTATSALPAASAVEAAEPNGETVDVVALDNTFRPERVEVVAGTTVRWENRGRNDHDVVPADDTVAWGVDASGFAAGDEYTRLFDTPGEYPYFCSIHGTKDAGMIGTVVVVVVAVDGATS